MYGGLWDQNGLVHVAVFVKVRHYSQYLGAQTIDCRIGF